MDTSPDKKFDKVPRNQHEKMPRDEDFDILFLRWIFKKMQKSAPSNVLECVRSVS